MNPQPQLYTNLSPIILASSSPRRKELLQMIGIDFKIVVKEVDETPLTGESPKALVERLAVLKGQSVSKENPDSFVISADTIVVLNEEILGKPKDELDAANMLKKMQGSQHQVFTAFALSKDGTIIDSALSISSVEMRAVSDEEISAYVKTKEPMDKAGSYALQGIGSSFINEVRGSFTGIIGLDVFQVVHSLLEHKVITVKN